MRISVLSQNSRVKLVCKETYAHWARRQIKLSVQLISIEFTDVSPSPVGAQPLAIFVTRIFGILGFPLKATEQNGLSHETSFSTMSIRTKSLSAVLFSARLSCYIFQALINSL